MQGENREKRKWYKGDFGADRKFLALLERDGHLAYGGWKGDR